MKIEKQLHQELIKRGATISSAESCSGGVISSRMVANDGASAYFLCGVVSYSNDAKVNVLGVCRADIEQHGAVSESVAIQMAEGVRRISGADYGISTTGIAGSSGGSVEKPIGTVWVGIATPTQSYAIVKKCGSRRSEVIENAATAALEELLKALSPSS